MCFLILDKGEGFSHSSSTSYCFILFQLSSFVAKSEPWQSWLGLYQQGNHLTLVSSNPLFKKFNCPAPRSVGGRSNSEELRRSHQSNRLRVGFMVLMLWLIRFIHHGLYVGSNAGVLSFGVSCVIASFSFRLAGWSRCDMAASVRYHSWNIFDLLEPAFWAKMDFSVTHLRTSAGRPRLPLWMNGSCVNVFIPSCGGLKLASLGKGPAALRPEVRARRG